MFEGEHEIGSDCVSCWLKNGHSVSASARPASGNEGHKYTIDFEVVRTETLRWPPSATLEKFTCLLAEGMVPRGEDIMGQL